MQISNRGIAHIDLGVLAFCRLRGVVFRPDPVFQHLAVAELAAGDDAGPGIAHRAGHRHRLHGPAVDAPAQFRRRHVAVIGDVRSNRQRSARLGDKEITRDVGNRRRRIPPAGALGVTGAAGRAEVAVAIGRSRSYIATFLGHATAVQGNVAQFSTNPRTERIAIGIIDPADLGTSGGFENNLITTVAERKILILIICRIAAIGRRIGIDTQYDETVGRNH